MSLHRRIENLYTGWHGWPNDRTAIIAEVGVNHGGDESLAWEMICAAYENGADFVKLQSFITAEFFHPSLPYYQNTKRLELSFEAQARLFEKANARGVRLMSTSFDLTSADFVDQFNPPAHKIASMDNDNLPLVRHVAAKGRPVIVSCGMAAMSEIELVATAVRSTGNKKLLLMHCVSDYPARPEDMHLSLLPVLSQTFGCPVGLSDHSLGLTSCFIAASLGVAAIEKHFTTDRKLLDTIPDADHDISIEPRELRDLRAFCEEAPRIIGSASRVLTSGEKEKRLSFRRGLYAKRVLLPGEVLNLESVVFLRPVQGISAGAWDGVCGRKVIRRVEALEPIQLLDIEQ